jgi:hypothetical protein
LQRTDATTTPGFNNISSKVIFRTRQFAYISSPITGGVADEDLRFVGRSRRVSLVSKSGFEQKWT